MKRLAGVALAAVMACGWASGAEASIIVDIGQSGSDVVVTGTGSLDLTGTQRLTGFSGSSGLRGNPPFFSFGSFTDIVGYSGVKSPGPIGILDEVFKPTSTSGDGFAINENYVFFTSAYESGSPVSFTASFANQTIDTLGLVDGSYVFKVPEDSVTVNITGGTLAFPTPVPLPSTIALFAGALLALGLVKLPTKAKRGLAR